MKQKGIFRKFEDKKASRFILGQQQGQAVVEYILMLVIIVSLILGLRGVFSSMNDYMSNIMGEYIACLMEFGELPSLGISDSDLKKHETGSGKRCQVPNFSATAAFSGGSGGATGGASAGGGSGNGKNSSNSNGANAGDSNKNAGKNGSGASGSESSEDSSSGAESSANQRGRRSSASSPYNSGQISRQGSASVADAPDSNAGGKVKVIEETADAGTGGYDDGSGDSGRDSRRGRAGRDRYKAITGTMAAEIEARSRIVRKPGATTLVATDSGYRLTALKRTVNPPEFKAPAEQKKDDDFSFGNFFKWLVIAGIIIAAFILFGGQVLNYSNRDSK